MLSVNQIRNHFVNTIVEGIPFYVNVCLMVNEFKARNKLKDKHLKVFFGKKKLIIISEEIVYLYSKNKDANWLRLVSIQLVVT